MFKLFNKTIATIVTVELDFTADTLDMLVSPELQLLIPVITRLINRLKITRSPSSVRSYCTATTYLLEQLMNDEVALSGKCRNLINSSTVLSQVTWVNGRTLDDMQHAFLRGEIDLHDRIYTFIIDCTLHQFREYSDQPLLCVLLKDSQPCHQAPTGFLPPWSHPQRSAHCTWHGLSGQIGADGIRRIITADYLPIARLSEFFHAIEEK